MRWESYQLKMSAQKGLRRENRKFLFVPKNINGTYKWLEIAYWQEAKYGIDWEVIRWITEEKYNKCKEIKNNLEDL